MGRTLATFRFRTQALRDRMIRILRSEINVPRYKRLWEDVNMLSSSCSAFNWPDTLAVITYSMLLDVMVKLDELEETWAKSPFFN